MVESSPDGKEINFNAFLVSVGLVYAIAAGFAFWTCYRWSRKRSGKPREPPSSRQHAATPTVSRSHQEPADTSQSSTPAKPGVSYKALKKSAKHKPSRPLEEAGPEHALLLNSLKGHTDSLTGLAFSSDGSALATTCADRLLRTFSLLDLETDARIAGVHRQLREDPVDVAFGADANSVVVLSAGIGDDYSVRMYHVNSADKKALVEVWHHPHIFNKERGRFLKCSGGVIVAASKDQQLVCLDLHGKPLASLATGGLTIHDLALSTSGRFVAAGTFTSDVKVYEITRDRAGAVSQVAKSNLSLKGHSGQVTALAFSPDDMRAVTASKDGTWGIWDLTVRYKLNEDAKRLVRAVQEVEKGTSMSHLAYGAGSIVAGAAGSTLLFMHADGQVLERVEGAHRGNITGMEFCPVPISIRGAAVPVLATSGEDRVVRLWRCPRH